MKRIILIILLLIGAILLSSCVDFYHSKRPDSGTLYHNITWDGKQYTAYNTNAINGTESFYSIDKFLENKTGKARGFISLIIFIL